MNTAKRMIVCASSLLLAACVTTDAAEPTSAGDGDADAPADSAGATTQAGAQHIAAGGDFTCAIKHDRTIACWGDDGSRTDPIVPPDGRLDPPAGAFVQLSTGLEHACALRADGSVACWGHNSQYGEATSPTGRFRSISAGTFKNCGVLQSGEPYCWGFGGLPGGSFWPLDAYNQIEVNAPTGTECTITVAGALACNDQGFNTYGEAAAPSGTFRRVSVGKYFGCAIRTDATVACWGQLPGATPSGSFLQVSTGDCTGPTTRRPHACGVKTNGTVTCWGGDTFGQSTPPSGKFREVSAGSEHSCGIRTNGTVACWGHGPGAIVPAGL